MLGKILTGKEVVEHISQELEAEQKKWSQKNERPKLTIFRIGNNPDDLSYQKSAIKKCELYGIDVITVEADNDEREFIKQFNMINNSKTDGLLILGKIPTFFATQYIQNNIKQEIDVDGFGNKNMAKLYSGKRDAVIPCTAEAVMELLKFYDINVSGKNVCILGRSLVIGKPLAMELLNKNATVTICHSKTKNLKETCKSADIIFSSIGKAKFINREYVKEGSIVIDIGINFDQEGKICGDVDYDDVIDIVGAITPVPKGVGPITNMVLMKHIYNIK